MKIKTGIYEHFKTGNWYCVIGVAKHSETLEEMVVYQALYDNKLSKLWVRPIKMFTEKVKAPDGKMKKRFKFIGKKEKKK